MRFFTYLLIVVVGVVFVACDSNDSYDIGYETAWEDQPAPTSIWTGKQLKRGYECGLEDSYMYDLGYDDSFEEKRPKYLNDSFYMEGYRDGKKYR